MNRPAFTLLELVLALALFAMSSIVAAGFLATTAVWACKSVRTLRADIATALALDVVTRDLMSARHDIKAWDVEQGVFMQETVDEKGVLATSWVGWDAVKQGLRRRQGVYDHVRHVWSKATSSIVGCALTDFKLQPNVHRDSGAVVAVTIVCAQPRTVKLVRRG